MFNPSRGALAVPALVAAIPSAVVAQPTSVSFEPPGYTGSPAGTPLSGQQSWYFPPNFSVDAAVLTYNGNTLGFVSQPSGGSQFLLTRPNFNPSRAEHAYDLAFAPVVTFQWDIAFIRTGPIIPPVDDIIGSFSLQPVVGSRYFIRSNRYSDVGNLEAGWNAAFLVAPADPGSPLSLDPITPGPAWRNLAFNHWYHESLTIDFSANRITSVSITDLVSGQTTTLSPLNYYLSGGSNPTLPMPTAIRFTGSNYEENATAWDNFSITAAGTACYANCDNSTIAPILNINDFVCFNSTFAAGGSYANCDNSTLPPTLNVGDFICFMNKYAAGCP